MYRYALRQERIVLKYERAAFLIPCQGLRGFDSISLLTFYLIPDPMQCHIIQSSPAVLITLISHANGQGAVGDFDTGDGGILPVGIGGEQAKVRLCKLMNRATNVLLLDEPTNHLDVDAKDELKRALKEYKGSILMVCHEPEFYDGLATQVWDLSQWTTKL